PASAPLHPYEVPRSVRRMQQVCAGIAHVVAPQGSVLALPPGPASGGLSPPSDGAPLLPPLLLALPEELLLAPPADDDPEPLAPIPPSPPSSPGLLVLPHPSHTPNAEVATPATR